MIIFNVNMQINYNAIHTSYKLKYTLLPGIVNRVCVCVLNIKYLFFNFIEIMTTNVIFMTKELVLALSNQVFLEDYIWKCW